MNIREKMKSILEAFYNNRFRRDEEVLTIMRKKEAEMEGNMLKKIQDFKCNTPKDTLVVFNMLGYYVGIN